MKNFKKFAIILAVIIVVIVVLIVFRDHWINMANAFLSWIQTQMGVKSDQLSIPENLQQSGGLG